MSTRIDLPLMNILEGYVRSFRSLNLFQNQNKSMFTKREIDHFSKLGEYLGFFSYVEDTKPNHDYGRSRPMDLAWWKWDERISKTHFVRLVLHLERESLHSKDFETVEKLFCKTDENYIPDNIIGILNVSEQGKIVDIQNEVIRKNKIQQSNVLMLYRFYDDKNDFDRLEAFHINRNSDLVETRKVISKIDETGYWTMCFEEEFGMK